MQTTSSTPARGSWLARRAAPLALARALPMVETQLRDAQVSGMGFLHLVLMDPGLPPGAAAFEEAILLEHSIGERARWDSDDAAFARAKARLSWQHGMDGQLLLTRLAHRLAPGDSLLRGGVCLDGIVVGVSGAEPWYDEAFGLVLAACLRAEVQRLAAEAARQGLLAVPDGR